jgi:hypothetical protein
MAVQLQQLHELQGQRRKQAAAAGSQWLRGVLRCCLQLIVQYDTMLQHFSGMCSRTAEKRGL